MAKQNDNIVTKSYFKTELKKELKAQRKEINLDIEAAIAGAKYEIIAEIKADSRQSKADILGAVADFGFTLPKLYA